MVADALLFLTYLVALLVLWRYALWRPRKVIGVSRLKPLLVGHRGVRATPSSSAQRGPPENTLAAFELALSSGLDGIETDVQRTADGCLVLFHDFEVSGRRLETLTLAELRRHDPGIPTLEQLFEVAKGYPGTLLNLEIKAERWRTHGLEQEVVRAIRASGLEVRVLVSSFSPLTLARVRLRAPGLRVGLLYAPDLPGWLRTGWLAPWLHADALHPHHSLVTPELLRKAQARGLMVNTWTVNEPMRITSLHSQKVSAIMGDDPAVLRRAAPKNDSRD